MRLRPEFTRAGGAVLLALISVTSAQAEEHVIEVQGGPPFKFEQPNITIKPGDTVKWVNKSGVLHTITADEDGALKGTDQLDGEGDTSEHAEKVKGKPRTINYHCEIHPKMKGTITVAAEETKAEEEPAPAPKKRKRKTQDYDSGGGYGGGGYGGY